MTDAPATPFCKVILEQKAATGNAAELATLRAEIGRLRAEVARLTAGLNDELAYVAVLRTAHIGEERKPMAPALLEEFIARQSRSALRGA